MLSYERIHLPDILAYHKRGIGAGEAAPTADDFLLLESDTGAGSDILLLESDQGAGADGLLLESSI